MPAPRRAAPPRRLKPAKYRGRLLRPVGIYVSTDGATPVVAASANRTSYSAAGTTVDIPIVAGVVNTSTCVVNIIREYNVTNPAASPITPPASGGTWAQVGADQLVINGTSSIRQSVFEYRAVGTESGNWTFTWTGTAQDGAIGSSHRITGAVTTGSIFDTTYDLQAAPANSTSAPNTTLTTQGQNRRVIWLVGGFSGGPTWTPPAGYTELFEVLNLTAAAVDLGASFWSGTVTGSNASSDRKLAFLGAIRPAPAGAAASGPAAGPQHTDGATVTRKQAIGAAASASRVAGSASGAKTAQGAASGQQRPSGASAAGRQTTGAAAGPGRVSGASSSRKQATAAVAGPTHTSGAAVTAKGGVGPAAGPQRTTGLASHPPSGPTGASSGAQRATGASSGVKGAVASQAGPTHTSGAASVRKQTAGGAAGPNRTAGLTAAAKAVAGATAGPTRSSGAAAVAKGGITSAAGPQRTSGAVASALFVGPNGPTRGAQRTSGASSGRKTGTGASVGPTRTAGAVLGIHRAAAPAASGQRTAGAASVVKGGRGAAIGPQRVVGLAGFSAIPPPTPPRWVEGATTGTNQTEGATAGSGRVEGTTGGSGQTEGATTGSGTREGVLAGVGIVEGSGGV